jgi:hypothetical protein
MSTVKLILNTNKVFKNFNKDKLNKLLHGIYHDNTIGTNGVDKIYDIEIMRITNNIIYNIFEHYTPELDDSVGLIIDYLIKAKSVLADSTLIKIINKALLYDNTDIIKILEKKLKGNDLEIYLEHVNHIPAPVPEVGKPTAGPGLSRPSSEEIVAARAAKVRGQNATAVQTLSVAPGSSVVTQSTSPAGPSKPPPTAGPGPSLPSSEEIAAAAARAAKVRGQNATAVKTLSVATGASVVTQSTSPTPTARPESSRLLSEQIAAEVAARKARGANAISGVAQISKVKPQINPVIESIKQMAQRNRSGFVDPRAKINEKLIGETLGRKTNQNNVPHYIGKRVRRKGTQQFGTITGDVNRRKTGTTFTVKYDVKQFPTTAEELIKVNILNNEKTPTAQPVAAPAGQPSAPPAATTPLQSSVVQPPPGAPPGASSATKQPPQGPQAPASPSLVQSRPVASPLQSGTKASPSLLQRRQPSAAPRPLVLSTTVPPLLKRQPSAAQEAQPGKSLMRKKATTFRNNKQPGKSLINTQNSIYSLENLGIKTVRKTSEALKETKQQQNINRGRPRKTIPINKINEFMKQKNRVEQIKNNTRNALNIGKLHSLPEWQLSNNNFKEGNKF